MIKSLTNTERMHLSAYSVDLVAKRHIEVVVHLGEMQRGPW